MSKLNKSMNKSKKDKRLKFQKYFNMGNIFTILDDIWDWICDNAEDIFITVLCVGMIAVLFGGMICLLLWSGNTGDGSNGSSSISSSISSGVVSNKLDK